MNVAVLSAVALAGLALTGCDKRQEQTVSVAITRGGSPVAGVDVRLYATQNCQGSYEGSTLNEDGKTAFSRTVEIGGVGVTTDELSICIGAGNDWTPLFSSLHGPAPGRIDIACDLAKEKGKCTTQFDDRPLDQPSEDEDDA
jgi:hypothetical protein